MKSSLDYKLAIKERLSVLSSRPTNAINLKKLARHLDMQYTYLSRILNSQDEHLKEDVLFEALHYLEFSEILIELYMQVRILQGSNSPTRIKRASEKIAAFESQKFSDVDERGRIESQAMAEVTYMLDPLATIVLASLSIPSIKKDTRKLMSHLGLDLEQLVIVLDKIEAAGFIERGEERYEVKKLITPRLQFNQNNQLMRLHQQQIKQLSLSILSKIPEQKKKSFMATFTADQKSFDSIKSEFDTFIKKVEGIAKQASARKVYQISFDLFDWL